MLERQAVEHVAWYGTPTLAIVLMELGRRLGVPLVGVGFPGHFLVRHACQPDLVLDPFDGGRPLTRNECVELLARIAEGLATLEAAGEVAADDLAAARRTAASLGVE